MATTPRDFPVMNSFHAGAQSSRHATARLAVRCAGASFAGADLPGREAVAIAMAVATPHG